MRRVVRLGPSAGVMRITKNHTLCMFGVWEYFAPSIIYPKDVWNSDNMIYVFPSRTQGVDKFFDSGAIYSRWIMAIT